MRSVKLLCSPFPGCWLLLVSVPSWAAFGGGEIWAEHAGEMQGFRLKTLSVSHNSPETEQKKKKMHQLRYMERFWKSLIEVCNYSGSASKTWMKAVRSKVGCTPPALCHWGFSTTEGQIQGSREQPDPRAAPLGTADAAFALCVQHHGQRRAVRCRFVPWANFGLAASPREGNKRRQIRALLVSVLPPTVGSHPGPTTASVCCTVWESWRC